MLLMVLAGFLFTSSWSTLLRTAPDQALSLDALKTVLVQPFTEATQQNWTAPSLLLPHVSLPRLDDFESQRLIHDLPDFHGVWAAALVIILFLERQGFQFAGFVLAVTWFGSTHSTRNSQLHMSGLALLCVAMMCVLLREVWRENSGSAALLAGIVAGFGWLQSPLCGILGIIALALLLYTHKMKSGMYFLLGAGLNVPVAFLMLKLQT